MISNNLYLPNDFEQPNRLKLKKMEQNDEVQNEKKIVRLQVDLPEPLPQSAYDNPRVEDDS